MFRSAAPRSLLRSLTTAGPVTTASPFRAQQLLRSQLCTVSRVSPLAPTRPLAAKTLALVRYQSGTPRDRKPMDEINAQHESEVAKEKLEVNPDAVSTTSSIHPFNSEIGQASKPKKKDDDDTEMLGGVKSDLV